MGLLDDFSEEEIKKEKKEPKRPEPEEIIEEPKGLIIQCDSKSESITTGNKHTYNLDIINDTSEEQDLIVTARIFYSSEKEDRVAWEAKMQDEKSLSREDDVFKKEYSLERNEKMPFKVEVWVPDGASYGEKLEVFIEATSKKNRLVSDTIDLLTIARPTVIAVKTQIGQEKNVSDYLSNLAKNKDLGIFSILSPKPVRGYIFLEVMSPHPIEDAIGTMRKAKGVVDGETDIKEIEHFLAPKLAVEGIAEGDIVELSAGPFKGEKARVTKIDESNDEITVELFEATVPIPVTIRGDHVRVIEKE